MSEPAPEALRALLAEAQRERGLSWGDLAAQVGIHRDYLTAIVEGQERTPSNRVMGALARALELDRDVLFAAAGRVPPELYEAAATAEGIGLLREFCRRREVAADVQAITPEEFARREAPNWAHLQGSAVDHVRAQRESVEGTRHAVVGDQA